MMKYLFSSLCLASSTLLFGPISNISNGAIAAKIYQKPQEKSYTAQKDLTNNPLPQKARKIEFVTATSIIFIGVILGTGRSIKLKKPKE